MKIRDSLLRASFLFLLLIVVVILACPVSVRAQSSETVTSNSVDKTGLTSPTRTIVTRSEQDGRTVETRRIEGPSLNGGYATVVEFEQETIKTSPTTSTVVTRQYSPDSSGNRHLVQVTKEQRSTAADGRETVVRTTSNADLNGGLQVVRRDVEETVPTGNDTKQTTSTTFLQIGSALQPVQRSRQTERKKGDVTEQQTTVLSSDGNGGFTPTSRSESTVTKTAAGETKDERMYGSNGLDGLTLVQRNVTTESKDAQGTHSTTQNYSAYVPGATLDPGKLALVQQVSSSQQTAPDGNTQSQEQVRAIDLGNPSSGLQLAVTVTGTSQPAGNGQTKGQAVVRSSNGNGGLSTVRVTDSSGTKVIP